MTRIPISLICLRVLAILDGLVLIRIILLYMRTRGSRVFTTRLLLLEERRTMAE